MRRALALGWLAVVAAAGAVLVVSLRHGLPLETDLMALLPREGGDATGRQAIERLTRSLSRRLVFAVGHAERDKARAAARRLSEDMAETGLFEPVAAFDAEALKKLGALYYPYRAGLLAESDRALLEAGDGQAVARKALAQAFAPASFMNASLLRGDPFLLLPSFLAARPLPMTRVGVDDGLLTARDGGLTWIILPGSLNGEPFALDAQKRMAGAYAASTAALRAADPDLQIKHLGAVFFAERGATGAIGEASALGLGATLGTILLIVAVFRRLQPLLANLAAAFVGIAVGLAGSLLIFGKLHAIALLLGTSLIGVAVDYGLLYSATQFDPKGMPAPARLRAILPGLTLGLITTLIGYAALAVAPLSGLRQVAVFSVIGLTAAFLTVVLWLPFFDHSRPIAHGQPWLDALGRMFAYWETPRRGREVWLLGAASLVAAAGLLRFGVNDDIRRMQALAPELVAEQEAIVRLTGFGNASQFLIVEAADDGQALRRQEDVRPVLRRLSAEGALASWSGPADFVPSVERQTADRQLVGRALTPLMASQRSALGLSRQAEEEPQAGATLTLAEALDSRAVPMLDALVLGPGQHVVALNGATKPEIVRAAFANTPGVRLLEPAADLTALLGTYRQRAVALIAASAAVMLTLLSLRYGLMGAVWVMAPPLLALVLTPCLLALAGQAFSFFHAMALVLVLAIGGDYAVFCAESYAENRGTAMLGITLAMLTTLLSFGLLATSTVLAISGFGWTMLVGIALAFVLAPLASRARHGRARLAEISARAETRLSRAA